MQLDLAQVLAILWRRRFSGASAFGVVAAGAVAFLLLATPRYDATALISIGDDYSAKGDLPSDKAIEEKLSSIAVISDGEDVVRAAAERVGFPVLFPKKADLLKKTEAAPGADQNVSSEADKLLPDLQRAILVKPLAKTNLISITFGHSDRVVAADFVNAMAESAINRQIELSTQPGAVDFYQVQRANYEEDVKRASSALARFVSDNSIYSVKLQQDLLIRRASDLEASLASTRGLIAERTSQKQTLVKQLTQIKPVVGSGQESDFLERFGGAEPKNRDDAGTSAQTLGEAATLPLPLDRVYRDGFASLVNLNSELSGLQGRESNLVVELNEVNAGLSKLSASTAEFNRLERAVDAATNNATTFERRAVDEAIGRDLAKAKLSNLRIAQKASIPLRPAFPNRRIVATAAFIGGLLAAIAAALGSELLARRFAHRSFGAAAATPETAVERRQTA